MTRAICTCLAFALTVLAPATSARAADIVGSATVLDGDTIEVGGQMINLYGIDAPELGQPCDRAGKSYWCGQLASQVLREALGDSAVVCQRKGSGGSNRPVRAVCRLDGVDVGGWLVAQGLALAHGRGSQDYVDAEEQARAYRKGLWGGGFTLPWVWRGEKP